jgi:hypothetical protein
MEGEEAMTVVLNNWDLSLIGVGRLRTFDVWTTPPGNSFCSITLSERLKGSFQDANF